MKRWVGGALFSTDQGTWVPAYELRTAKTLGLDEAWLRYAIAQCPKLVTAVCAEAGLIGENEEWRTWKTEFPVVDEDRSTVGAVDVLLVSSSGSVAVIETKLSSNPAGRRTVIAQALDYAVNISELSERDFPPIPLGSDGKPLTTWDAIERRLIDSDLTIIIAGDALDPRAVKLSQGLLGGHLTRRWTLALVELAVFEKVGTPEGLERLIVPYVRGAVVPEVRQVVRVVVEGAVPRTRISVETVERDDSVRTEWTEDSFFRELRQSGLDTALKRLADHLREISRRTRSATLDFGKGALGSMTLKQNGSALVGLRLDGRIWFSPAYFERALGKDAGYAYLSELRTLFPGRLPAQPGREWPVIPANEAAEKATELGALVSRHVDGKDPAGTLS